MDARTHTRVPLGQNLSQGTWNVRHVLVCRVDRNFPVLTCPEDSTPSPSLLVPKCCQRLSHLPLDDEQPQTTAVQIYSLVCIFNMLHSPFSKESDALMTPSCYCKHSLSRRKLSVIVLSTKSFSNTFTWRLNLWKGTPRTFNRSISRVWCEKSRWMEKQDMLTFFFSLGICILFCEECTSQKT